MKTDVNFIFQEDAQRIFNHFKRLLGIKITFSLPILWRSKPALKKAIASTVNCSEQSSAASIYAENLTLKNSCKLLKKKDLCHTNAMAE